MMGKSRYLSELGLFGRMNDMVGVEKSLTLDALVALLISVSTYLCHFNEVVNE